MIFDDEIAIGVREGVEKSPGNPNRWRQLMLLAFDQKDNASFRTLQMVSSGIDRMVEAERRAAGDEAARLAAAQLVAERQRLDLGLGDSFRLLETEENAVQAELESVRSRYDLARATTRLRLARGEIRAP